MTTVRLTPEVLARRPEDPGKGEHLWILSVAFKVSEESVRLLALGRDPGDIMMDHENIVSAPGLGCYKCEEPFSPRLFYRKCTGTMDLQS